MTFTVQRPAPGRRFRDTCLPAGRRPSGSLGCTRWIALSNAVTRRLTGGHNRLLLSGRLGGRRLAPGGYRLLTTLDRSAPRTRARRRRSASASCAEPAGGALRVDSRRRAFYGAGAMSPANGGQPADRGLFGPDTVAWRVIGHPVALIGGQRALIVQSLHPLAMAGRGPAQRLPRTARWTACAARPPT